MRVLLFMGALFASHCTLADDTFLLIDAVAMPADLKQPTWIAVRGNGRQIHLPAGESIIAIEPGVYRLEHIDFQRYRGSGEGTVFTQRGSDMFSFEVAPNAITHVGIVELTSVGKGRQTGSTRQKDAYTIKWGSGEKLLSWACEKNPEPFLRLPVRYVDEDGELQVMKVRCET